MTGLVNRELTVAEQRKLSRPTPDTVAWKKKRGRKELNLCAKRGKTI